VAVIVKVGIYVHVDVQAKRMANVATITPNVVIGIITGNDIVVFNVVATGCIVVFTRDPNETTETGRDHGGVRSDGEKSVLLFVVAFEAVEKWEKDVVGGMGSGGGMMNGRKLGGRESADGCMRGRTREEDGERGEEIWGIIEAVHDIVFGRGGVVGRVHVWRMW
jgi:hypothetical protein